MYNTIYVILKFTCPVDWKNWNIFPDKNKNIFQNQRPLRLIGQNILNLMIPDTRSWL